MLPPCPPGRVRVHQFHQLRRHVISPEGEKYLLENPEGVTYEMRSEGVGENECRRSSNHIMSGTGSSSDTFLILNLFLYRLVIEPIRNVQAIPFELVKLFY